MFDGTTLFRITTFLPQLQPLHGPMDPIMATEVPRYIGDNYYDDMITPMKRYKSTGLSSNDRVEIMTASI